MRSVTNSLEHWRPRPVAATASRKAGRRWASRSHNDRSVGRRKSASSNNMADSATTNPNPNNTSNTRNENTSSIQQHPEQEGGAAKRSRLSKAPASRSRDAGGVTPVSVAENTISSTPPSTSPRGPYPGLEGLAEKYTLGRILGMGTYGQVHRASDKKTGETVALKMIETVAKHRVEYGFPEAVLREIKILRQLRFHVAKPHPNIITLRNIVLHREKENTICLVMDYMDVDLRVLLSYKNRQLPRGVAQCYLYQLISAVTFVHENHIIHRDLKPSNIVVNSRHQLKVVDWGLARIFRRDNKIRYENSVCTAWYRSPELVLGCDRYKHGYGPPIDMWSFGCIFVELLLQERGSQRLRRTPFDPHVPAGDGSGRMVLPPGLTTIKGPTHFTSPSSLWKVITDKLGMPTPTEWPKCDQLKHWANFSQLGLTSAPSSQSVSSKRAAYESELRMGAMSSDAVDLAMKLLELDPKKRIIARDAMAHRYFHGGKTDSRGRLVLGGAVPKLKDLQPWTDLDQAHSDRLKKEAARNNGGAAAAWKGSGGEDILGED